MRLGVLFCVAFFVSCAVLENLINRAIYYPMQYPAGCWEAQALIRAQDRWLQTADGVRLHSWWVPSLGNSVATLFLHGNGGNITHRAQHAVEITGSGSSVLLLDYRGYGRSEGRPTEVGLYADADAAYEMLRAAGYSPDQIVIHGESLGTAVAVDLAVRKRCAGVILEAPLRSAGMIAGRVMPFIGPLLVRGFDTESKVGRLRSPLLIIHGDLDEVVPFSHGHAVFDAAAQPKELWTVAGAHHNDLLAMAGPLYCERLHQFYSALPKRAKC
jgi:fermentation-respiration switch protein FrsA (DUF1100 family)